MKFNKNILTAALLTIGGFAAVSANAAETANFGIQATITETCNVDAGSDIDLGNIVAGVTGTTGETATAIKVNCSNLTAYNLGLTTLNNGVMLGGNEGAEAIPYQMFSDSSNSTLWGNTVGTDTVTGTGDGMLTIPKEHTLYIKADATDVSQGTYTDTINVTVTY